MQAWDNCQDYAPGSAMNASSSNSLYEMVAGALSLMASDVDPAECHGMLCGMLCSRRRFEPRAWLEHLCGYDDSTAGTLTPDHALSLLVRETLSGMDADDYSFRLLLPPDDDSLSERTGALGSWCRGFLSGFGVGEMHELSRESREFLIDLSRISQVDPGEGAGEAGEQAFVEIVEYARMGAILLREEHRDVMTPAPDGSTVH